MNISPEITITFAKCFDTYPPFSLGRQVYSARPSAQDKSGYRADGGAGERREGERGTAARTVPEVAKSIFNSKSFYHDQTM